MRAALIVHISTATEARLHYAAAELGEGMSYRAGQCIEAAAQLWVLDPATSTIPPVARGDGRCAGDEALHLSISGRAVSIMGFVAVDRGLGLEELLCRVLDAAVAGYEPVALRRKDIVPGGGVPHREPFDPKRYAGSRAVTALIEAEEAMAAPAIACARPLPAVRSKPQSRRRPPEGEGCE
jgi:hypothetical protein